ncbi:hypothetical protein CDL15_Pgr008442 [Punica granatum]|uniref:Glu S.griseus protease inhibitor-like n=1 Tax=Punica granatum TaxID=22663 RepID=A0A218WPH3_PUNGR|nr:hypothetical protein CDL15_Pgr008442 [Punica granatum]PKI46297.1 hypothetical protein CRG98_033306 [Punica granatum]
MASGSCPAGKSSWPELIGLNGEAASAKIMMENPKVQASTVKEGSFVTSDFRCDRVRVWVDNSDIVTRVPQIG